MGDIIIYLLFDQLVPGLNQTFITFIILVKLEDMLFLSKVSGKYFWHPQKVSHHIVVLLVSICIKYFRNITLLLGTDFSHLACMTHFNLSFAVNKFTFRQTGRLISTHWIKLLKNIINLGRAAHSCRHTVSKRHSRPGHHPDTLHSYPQSVPFAWCYRAQYVYPQLLGKLASQHAQI